MCLAALAALGAPTGACATPTQGGEILVLPGSAARLVLAMRMGYAGVGDAVAPARVERAVLDEQLPEGPAATGALGDWVLENDRVIAVVTAVDGSSRGGRLVDLTDVGGAEDRLEAFDATVVGRAIRYDAGKSGRDEATGTAYVEVQGRVLGAPGLRVSTRYDVAPGLPAVVVHTQVVGLGSEPRDAPVLVDTIRFGGPGTIRSDDTAPPLAPDALSPGHVAWVDRGFGYLLRPLSDARLVVSSTSPRSAWVGLADAPVDDGPLLHTRVLAPLSDVSDEGVARALERLEGREPPPDPVEPELDGR